MQLLRACHSVLQAPGAAAGGGLGAGDSRLAIHCFEVTPLGARVGLVQVSMGRGEGGTRGRGVLDFR